MSVRRNYEGSDEDRDLDIALMRNWMIENKAMIINNCGWTRSIEAMVSQEVFIKVAGCSRFEVNVLDVMESAGVESAEKTPQGPNESNFNKVVNVHCPGPSLAVYNEICLLEDSCTDILQSKLNEGWRIIAACPQPDQRRPDYILGRFNPTYTAEQYAKR